MIVVMKICEKSGWTRLVDVGGLPVLVYGSCMMSKRRVEGKTVGCA